MNLVGSGKPFYSNVDMAAKALRRKVGTGAEFMKELMAIPGIKQTEIQERALGEIMGMPKMTHEQFMAALNAKPAPAIREKVLGEAPSQKEIIKAANRNIRLSARNYSQSADTTGEAREMMNDEIRRLRELHRPQLMAAAAKKIQTEPYHDEYTLPGGENYREMLIKAPASKNYTTDIMALEADLRRTQPDDPSYGPLMEKLQALRNEASKTPKQFEGVSAHFGGEPGILASMRLKDRIGPNGEKLLHLEELQSDWHQQGREKGYKEKPFTKQDEKRFQDIYIKHINGKGLTPEEVQEFQTLNASRDAHYEGVPNAPFKKNWEEMALKRLIHHAAENGYHGIVVTPGEEQADRYDLSKHIDDVFVSKRPDGSYDLNATKNGQLVLGKNNLIESQLEEYVGKELAKKTVNDLQSPDAFVHPTTGDVQKRYSGLDLKVGGEGMKGFYDKKVPNILNGIGKKYGVKTELGGHTLENNQWKLNGQMPELQNKSTALHIFPITEDMRKDVLTNGLPLYAEGGIIRKAEGGNVQPSLSEMKTALAKKASPIDLKNIGLNEALNVFPKVFFPPEKGSADVPAPGGVATPSGMPIGGIDMSQQTGQQLMPQNLMQPQQPQQPSGALPTNQAPQGPQGNPQAPQQSMGNLLQMTPQGQTMAALGGGPKPPGMATGGSAKSVDDMKAELAAKAKAKAAPQASDDDDDEEEEKAPSKRILVKAEGPGGVTGIVIPHHMLHGRSWVNKKGNKVVVPGLKDINKSRAEVYGAENRDPLTLGQMAKIHKDTLAEHFNKPLKDQLAAEKEATSRLRAAKHLGAKNNTLDESEKLDTVRHETDEQGRTHVGFASKGVAGHALYTSGHGENEKHHIINTCPGQTEGCGGGKDAKGVIDTSRGTCFAPGAESQYVHAAVRRACHEQAKHDPAMTRDWILAHTGSMREAAKKADKNNQRLLFRPNVVDETDVSSRHSIRHLNEQRKEEGRPDIIANSYGKTNELHDPENGYYVTHSNVGPKVKKGQEIAENVGRDKARVRNTVMAADNRGDFKNEQGNKTPPKGSYMVTDVKRNSPMSKKMEEHITHAKYWTTGRSENELSADEKDEGPEGHFSGSGRRTSEDKAHYGHTTIEGKRFDYQKQHILHPRLVNVPIRKKNKKTGEMETKDHMIPTDSRFKDTEFLPKNRFKTKNGKDAGHILMTTPTESTSNIGHQTSFTHHVNEDHIKHAINNNGEYEIDKPEDQIKAAGKEYLAPQSIKFYAEGGAVNGMRHHGYSDDDFHAFPERNVAAQRHLAMRRGEDESQAKYHSDQKNAVKVHKNMDTMRLELTRKK